MRSRSCSQDPAGAGRLPASCDGVYDLERLNGRISLASAGAKDLVASAESLAAHPALKEHSGRVRLRSSAAAPRRDRSPGRTWRTSSGGASWRTLPLSCATGGSSPTATMPSWTSCAPSAARGRGSSPGWRRRRKARTGISSLKIRYNKVFGYYIEVTKTNLAGIPDDYIRRQTLANAERFVTPELKEYEEKVLGAEERIAELEYSLFQEIRETVAAQGARIARTADQLAGLDVLVCPGRAGPRPRAIAAR